MKKIFSFLMTTVFIAAICIFLITENPSVEDFSRWYVDSNPTSMGAFFDDVYTTIVSTQTVGKDYILFSIFELDNAKYVGIAGHFWGRNSVEEAKETAGRILEQAMEQVGKGTSKENSVGQ